MSWPIASVRGDGRDQSRTSPFQRLAASLSWIWAKLAKSKGWTKREAAKHVESFGVGFWIRVRFPAPPPSQNFGLRIADCGFEGASISPRNPQSPQCPHSPHVDSWLRRDPPIHLGGSCAP